MSTEIEAGGLIVFDPSDKRAITFNWDDALDTDVEINSSNWTITAVKQADIGASLTKDNEAVADDNRSTVVRLLATTASLGDIYIVNNKVTTNETPAQEFEQSFRVLVQNR